MWYDSWVGAALPFVWNKLLTVTNYREPHINQALFLRDGQHRWRAELIDWAYASVAEGWSNRLRKNPKEAFGIPKNSGIYIPPVKAFEVMRDSR